MKQKDDIVDNDDDNDDTDDEEKHDNKDLDENEIEGEKVSYGGKWPRG